MASSEPIKTEYAHIVQTPGIAGGEPRIDGLRIRVRDVVAARDRGGYAPEEIAATVYPSLTLAQVYAALGYYEDHRRELDARGEVERETVEHFRKQHRSLVGNTDDVPPTE